jgi:hypothetical protein
MQNSSFKQISWQPLVFLGFVLLKELKSESLIFRNLKISTTDQL